MPGRGLRLLTWLVALLDETSLLLLFPGEAGTATPHSPLAGQGCPPARPTAQKVPPSVTASEQGTLGAGVLGGGTLNPANTAS